MFSGTIDLENLPRKLIQVQIDGILFTDLRNVCNLPPNLERLAVNAPNIAEKDIHVAKLREGDKPVLEFQGCGITWVDVEHADDRKRITY